MPRHALALYAPSACELSAAGHGNGVLDLQSRLFAVVDRIGTARTSENTRWTRLVIKGKTPAP